MSDLQVHPVADLFPMLADDELADLAEEIKQRGLLQPIILDTEGRVLDGRNRLAACKLAGVEPRFTTYEGDDPTGYALAVNIARRHLTTGARAVIAAKAAKEGWLDQRKIAADTNLYQARIAEASVVLKWAPDLANGVVAGDPLSGALATARQRKAEAERRAAKLSILKAEAEDLHTLVEEERMGVDDAIAALRDRQEKARQEAERIRREAEEAAERARLEAEAMASEEARRQAEEDAKRESERRAAITNLQSVLTYLVSTSITPAQLAERDYAIAVDEFKTDDLDYAAATMAAIAALKEN